MRLDSSKRQDETKGGLFIYIIDIPSAKATRVQSFLLVGVLVLKQ